MWAVPLAFLVAFGVTLVVVQRRGSPLVPNDPREHADGWWYAVAFVAAGLGPALLLHQDHTIAGYRSRGIIFGTWGDALATAWPAFVVVLLVVRFAPAFIAHGLAQSSPIRHMRRLHDRRVLRFAGIVFAAVAVVASARVVVGGQPADAFEPRVVEGATEPIAPLEGPELSNGLFFGLFDDMLVRAAELPAMVSGAYQQQPTVKARDVWRELRPPRWPLVVALALALVAGMVAVRERGRVASLLLVDATALLTLAYAQYLGM